MNRNRLKIVGLIWAACIIATVWIDRWAVSYLFSFISCLLGVITLTASSAVTEKERKESKKFGLLLLMGGILFALIEMADGFVLGRF